MPQVILYDLASDKGTLSPFAWRVRLALNFKQIKYETRWLTFVEIEPHLKSIGAPPTGKRPDTGADLYTLPVLSVDGEFIADSVPISEYLDRAFPETPALFPPGTRALQTAFLDFFSSRVLLATAMVLAPAIPSLLDAENGQYFRDTRAAWYGGTPLDEWAPDGSEKRKEAWKVAEESWGTLASIYRKSEGRWSSGEKPVFADFVVIGTLAMMSKAARDDEWEMVLGWHSGIWNRLIVIGHLQVRRFATEQLLNVANTSIAFPA